MVQCVFVCFLTVFHVFPWQPTTKLFIDGKFVDSETTEWLDIHNPVSRIAQRHTQLNFNDDLNGKSVRTGDKKTLRHHSVGFEMHNFR